MPRFRWRDANCIFILKRLSRNICKTGATNDLETTLPRINLEDADGGSRMKRGHGKHLPVFAMTGFNQLSEAKAFMRAAKELSQSRRITPEFIEYKNGQNMYFPGVVRKILAIARTFTNPEMGWFRKKRPWVVHWGRLEGRHRYRPLPREGNRDAEPPEEEVVTLAKLRSTFDVEGVPPVDHRILEIDYVPSTMRPSRRNRETGEIRRKKAIWEIDDDDERENEKRAISNETYVKRIKALAFDLGISREGPDRDVVANRDTGRRADRDRDNNYSEDDRQRVSPVVSRRSSPDRTEDTREVAEDDEYRYGGGRKAYSSDMRVPLKEEERPRSQRRPRARFDDWDEEDDDDEEEEVKWSPRRPDSFGSGRRERRPSEL